MTLLGKLVVFALAASVTAVPFMYYPLAPSDTEYHSALKKLKTVLSKEGLIDPEGITVEELQSKNEIYRASFKAHFFTKDGKECNYKWREVVYSSTSIAYHKCTAVPVVLPSVGKQTTTPTEGPPVTSAVGLSIPDSDELMTDADADVKSVESDANGENLVAQRSGGSLNKRRNQRRRRYNF